MEDVLVLVIHIPPFLIILYSRKNFLTCFSMSAPLLGAIAITIAMILGSILVCWLRS